jgi:hypothetical protein
MELTATSPSHITLTQNTPMDFPGSLTLVIQW